MVFPDKIISHWFFLQVMVGENQYLELEGITKANVQTNLLELAGMPFKAKNANYYITFTAKDIERNFTKTLQALIYKRVLEDGVMQIAIISTRLLSTVEGNLRLTKLKSSLFVVLDYSIWSLLDQILPDFFAFSVYENI